MTGSSDAELRETAIIFGRIDKDRSGLITLPKFVEAMNALSNAQGKEKHTDTRLLALLLSIRRGGDALSRIGLGSSPPSPHLTSYPPPSHASFHLPSEQRSLQSHPIPSRSSLPLGLLCHLKIWHSGVARCSLIFAGCNIGNTQAMFHMGDLADTGEVDMNEFLHMQRRRKRKTEKKKARSEAKSRSSHGDHDSARSGEERTKSRSRKDRKKRGQEKEVRV